MHLLLISVLLLSAMQSVIKPQTPAKQEGVHKGEAEPSQQHADNGTTDPSTRPVQTPKCSPEQYNPYDPKQDSLYRWYLRVTIGGVAVGLIGLAFLYAQHRTARQALEVSQRADVLIDGISLTFGDSPEFKDSAVNCRFHNHGNTRAIHCIISLILEIPGVPTDPYGHQILPVTIGPGAGQTISSPHFIEFLTKETAQGIVTGVISLNAIAEITYEDVFGDTHWQKAGAEYVARARTFKVTFQETDE